MIVSTLIIELKDGTKLNKEFYDPRNARAIYECLLSCQKGKRPIVHFLVPTFQILTNDGYKNFDKTYIPYEEIKGISMECKCV